MPCSRLYDWGNRLRGSFVTVAGLHAGSYDSSEGVRQAGSLRLGKDMSWAVGEGRRAGVCVLGKNSYPTSRTRRLGCGMMFVILGGGGGDVLEAWEKRVLGRRDYDAGAMQRDSARGPQFTDTRGRGCVVVRLLTSHQNEPSSIPDGVTARISACGNRAEICRWSAGSLGDLPFPSPLRSGAALYSPRFALVGSRTNLFTQAHFPDIRCRGTFGMFFFTNVTKVKAVHDKALDDSAPIADLQGNKKRILHCQMWGSTGVTANEQTSDVRLYKGLWSLAYRGWAETRLRGLSQWKTGPGSGWREVECSACREGHSLADLENGFHCPALYQTPRIPDANPLDFTLWGHLKALVYATLVYYVGTLRNRIVAGCETNQEFSTDSSTHPGGEVSCVIQTNAAMAFHNDMIQPAGHTQYVMYYGLCCEECFSEVLTCNFATSVYALYLNLMLPGPSGSLTCKHVLLWGMSLTRSPLLMRAWLRKYLRSRKKVRKDGLGRKHVVLKVQYVILRRGKPQKHFAFRHQAARIPRLEHVLPLPIRSLTLATGVKGIGRATSIDFGARRQRRRIIRIIINGLQRYSLEPKFILILAVLKKEKEKEKYNVHRCLKTFRCELTCWTADGSAACVAGGQRQDIALCDEKHIPLVADCKRRTRRAASRSSIKKTASFIPNAMFSKLFQDRVFLFLLRDRELAMFYCLMFLPFNAEPYRRVHFLRTGGVLLFFTLMLASEEGGSICQTRVLLVVKTLGFTCHEKQYFRSGRLRYIKSGVELRVQGQEARGRYGRHYHARPVPHRAYAQGAQCFRPNALLCKLDLQLPTVADLICTVERHDGNTARLARRSDETLGVRVSVARIAPSLLDLGRAAPPHS
ncbi:hypothetical protein PR048_003431 [Dryococelus australis]|uniref:Uncharacterized protein n=1 Tax=Dryococelus australis TaxID=614101 RepID=A0ABQ9IP06_9NEOP|nr:hypothetical protein PR048_003431 [Dryococelus australis]